MTYTGSGFCMAADLLKAPRYKVVAQCFRNFEQKELLVLHNDIAMPVACSHHLFWVVSTQFFKLVHWGMINTQKAVHI